MAKGKKKSVSFDAMVKFFMQNYEIPTKRDLERISSRLDHLEQLILKTAEGRGGGDKAPTKIKRTPGAMTASDTVLEVIRDFKDGVKISEIQARTGYDEKKLRNIIFRLHDTDKIKRKSRGVYYVP